MNAFACDHLLLTLAVLVGLPACADETQDDPTDAAGDGIIDGFDVSREQPDTDAGLLLDDAADDGAGLADGADTADAALDGLSGLDADATASADAPDLTSTPDGADTAELTNEPGRHDHTISVDGLDSHFIVYVPELAADTAAPVVLMLHGTSGDGERFYQISGWVEKADEVGLIAVFPDALTYCFFEDEDRDGEVDDRHVTTKWASGGLGDPEERRLCDAEDLSRLRPRVRALADHPLRDDVAFVDGILDLLENEYQIDTSRVYVTGFSNGGQMSARLAIERSDRFAAAAVAAGGLEVEPVPTPYPISLLFSLGSLDDRYTEPLGIDEIPMDEEILADGLFYDRIMAPFLTALVLEDDYVYDTGTVGGQDWARFTFATSTRGESNQFAAVVLEGLYHQYPNGENYPLVGADVLWDFFSQFHR